MVSHDTTAQKQLRAAVAEFYADPLGFVMFAFPWDTNSTIQAVKLGKKYRERFGAEYGPDVWACEFLDQLGEEIRKRDFDGFHPVLPIQFATTSGHGIGKSVLVAWLVLFIMSTRPFANGVVTATTAEQLKSKTWAEVGKWWKLCITKDWFEYSATRGNMALVAKADKEKWKAIAQTCKEENSDAFAGVHAANSTPFYIFDEASGVPDKIFEVREGGTTDGEPMVFDFGNPTKNSGRLFEECRGKLRERYIIRTIDSRSVAITNKERIKQWEEDFGAESDFFKVRVRGVFPAAGNLQFIPTNYVDAAMLREPTRNRYDQIILGVDVARQGGDESVIASRLGDDLRSFPLKRFRGLDNVELAGKVTEEVSFYRSLGLKVSAIFVDATGVGAGVFDILNHSGFPAYEIHFGNKAIDDKTYRYRGDEMWGRLRDALKNRLVLPKPTDLYSTDIKNQLTQREFGYTLAGNKINLESKRDMKDRLGQDASPDIGDAYALTYAMEIAPGFLPQGNQNSLGTTQHDYDPHKDM